MMKRSHNTCQLFSMLLLTVALLFSALAAEAHAESDRQNILIINSYHKGLQWTDNELEGITSSLKEYGYHSDIYVEYMDWKRYPSEENLSRLYNYFEYKYSEKPVDIVITTDDIALEFALKNRAELFSDAPIVFCGVNEDGIRSLVQGHKRVTGVSEIIDPVNTVRAALKMRPETKEVYLVFDNSESGHSTGKLTIAAIKGLNPDIRINTMNRMGIDQLLDEVSRAPEDSFILVTTYYKDYYGRDVGFEESAGRISERSKVPVFHLYDFGLGNGAIGGSILSGEADGKRAGAIAARILDGEQISLIPVETLQNMNYVFDYEKLIEFDIDMDSVPEGSKFINKPYTFLEEHRDIIITVLVVFSLLITFIIILVHYLRKITIMKRALQLNNEELTKSANTLQRQYDELEKVQKELTGSEERYSLLFRRMLNGFIIFEPVFTDKGKIVDVRFKEVNPAYELQNGLSRDELVGKTWQEVRKYPNRNLGRYNRILKTGEPMQFETYHSHNNKYYLVSAFKISDCQVGIVGEDITEYKNAIKEITVLNEELEQRVAERTDELQSAVNELEAFTYTVSHDLKSPIRAIDGYSRIMMEDLGDKLGEEGEEMLRNIRGISRDMIDMISKLLKYSTTSKEPIDKEKLDSGELVSNIFNELLSANPERNIRLVVETGLPEILADKVMLKQVIYNILSNAVKFTRYREEAVITVGCTITADEYIFYVKDNGEGFDMEYSKKLFGIFQRLHGADEFEGSGIGLVTVKKIIQRHGGRVWIEGRTGLGAEVYFTLPIAW